jgi:uncharacterized protein YdeI (BOF family)
MRSIKQDLAVGFGLSALVFTCALAWGSPFVSSSSSATSSDPSLASAQDQPQQAPSQPPEESQQPQDKSITLTGTVVRDAGQFLLRDSSGQVYKLDDPERVKPFEGKAVKVVGQLDSDAELIHVETIESVRA